MSLSERYELGELLGEGGFGKTYAATRRQPDGEGVEAVVVKQLDLRALPDWKPFEQFEREARVLASLDHPGVPRFVEAIHEGEEGTGGDLRLYLVSERIAGGTLGARISKGHRWSADAAESLCRGLLEVLRYLHELLPPVIHRDIKPDNVVLREDGAPVLVDFGAVRELAIPGATGGATVLGTPGYMAPEQALGRVDARSDLYGLGMTLVHVFTHRHPRDLLDAAMQLDAGALEQLPERVRELLTSLTRTDPTARPVSAAAALAILDGEVSSSALAPAASPTALAPAGAPAPTALAPLTREQALAPAGGRELTPALRQTLKTLPIKPERATKFVIPWAMAVVAMVPLMVLLGSSFMPYLLVPMIAAAAGGPLGMVFSERARTRRLYERGVEARGVMTGAKASQMGTFVDYEFEVDGQRFTGGNAYTRDSFVISRLQPGAPVRVFYDPDKPERNFGLLE